MSLSAEEREIRARDVADRDVDFLLGLLDASRAQAEALAGALEFQRDHKPGLLPQPLAVLAAYRKGLP